MEKDAVEKILKHIRKQSVSNHFPHWVDFPDVDLYMDQVIELINKYQTGIPCLQNKSAAVTPSMVNNYVKMKLMPPPVKKRYSKLHLAYIMVICTLKHTFSIATIETILRPDFSEEAMESFYDTFAQNQETALDRILSDTASLAAKCENSSELFLLQLLSDVNMRKSLGEHLAETIMSQ